MCFNGNMSNQLKIGQRVTVNIGGQTHTLTIGDTIKSSTTGKVEAIRSTTDTDHVWTKMWINVGCIK